MPAPQPLENFFRFLLPPACREHVLGDLQERYKSRRSYLIDGLSVLGPVNISRIRRTTDLQIFFMEGLTIYLSFAVTAWYLEQQSFLYDHAGFVRLVVPTIVAVVALLFCNAYSDPERKYFSKPIVQSAGSISLAFLGQAAVFDTQPSLAVPFRTMLYGSLLSFMLVSPLRALFPPVQRRPSLARLDERRSLQGQQFAPVNPLRDLRDRAGQIQYDPKFRLVFAILIALVIGALLLAPSWHARVLISRAMLAVLVLFLVYWLKAGE